MTRLFDAIQGQLASYHKRALHNGQKDARNREQVISERHYLGQHLQTFEQYLHTAEKKLDYFVSERRKADAERDLLAKLDRETQEQDRREAQSLQMQRFVESTMRMRRTGETKGSRLGRKDSYFEEHGGWHYWEDDRLLGVIRKVARPNVEELAAIVLRRSSGEIEQRLGILRERVRRKYEAEGVVPPHWCYSTT